MTVQIEPGRLASEDPRRGKVPNSNGFPSVTD
jgi:hypothetical protein